jgi:alkylhydroperoxidase family enzyme
MTRPEPRLPPLPFADWDDDTRSVLLQSLRRPELYLSGAPDAPPMPVVLEVLAHHLSLSESWLRFSDMLSGNEARLSSEHRELLILRVAWRSGSGYEWNQHERIGREAGLTAAQIDAIRQDSTAGDWAPRERALLAAVDEMIDRFAVTEETWQSLITYFDSAQILEMLFVIGGYLCLAGVLNSVGLWSELPGEPTHPDRRVPEA